MCLLCYDCDATVWAWRQGWSLLEPRAPSWKLSALLMKKKNYSFLKVYPEGIWRRFSDLSHSLFSHWGWGPDSRHHSRWVAFPLRSHCSQVMGALMKKICIFIYSIKITKKRAIPEGFFFWTTATNTLYNDEQARYSNVSWDPASHRVIPLNFSRGNARWGFG